MLRKEIVIFRSRLFLFVLVVVILSVSVSPAFCQIAQTKRVKGSARYEEWRKEDFTRKFKYLGRKNEDMRQKAVKIISKDYIDLVADKLISLLESENKIERLSGVEIVGKYAHERYKPILLKLMQTEPQTYIRQKALNNLKAYRTADVSQALLAALLDEQRLAGEKVTIIQMLSKNKYEPAIPVIETALHDQEESVRAIALFALSGLRDDKYIEVFIKAFDDESENVRYTVLKALQVYDFRNDSKIREFLQRAVHDKSIVVRNLVKKMLASRGVH